MTKKLRKWCCKCFLIQITLLPAHSSFCGALWSISLYLKKSFFFLNIYCNMLITFLKMLKVFSHCFEHFSVTEHWTQNTVYAIYTEQQAVKFRSYNLSVTLDLSTLDKTYTITLKQNKSKIEAILGTSLKNLWSSLKCLVFLRNTKQKALYWKHCVLWIQSELSSCTSKIFTLLSANSWKAVI